MKSPNFTCFARLSCRRLACLVALGLIARADGAGELVDKAPSVSPADLQKLEMQLEEQTRRIDRLYRALGPHLEELEAEAEETETQQREDKALALERIREVQDDDLAAVGCANPAAREFGVLTRSGGVRLYDARGEAVKELQQPGQVISCLAFSPEGGELLTGTKAGALLVWDLERGTCGIVSTNVGRAVERVTWLGKDRVVWGAYQKYWEDGGKPVDHDKPAGAVLTRDGGQVLWSLRGFVRDDFYTLAGAPDGSALAVLEIPGQPRGAFLLDSATGEVLRSCYDEAHGSGPLSVSLSPDGSTLAVGYAPYDIILWNARTGERQRLLKGHSNWVVSLAFSADGSRLISGAGDSTARVWDVQSGCELGRLRFSGSSSYVEGVGLSPEGDVAFAVAQGVLVVATAPPAARAP